MTSEAEARRSGWLSRLPAARRHAAANWSLTIGQPFTANSGTCSWVAPVTRADGTSAVLKIGMPHMEADHEADGLRFWNGDPTVKLIDSDESFGAMLLERCTPGTPLSELPEPEQDRIIAGLLRRLWRIPAEPHPFRPLSKMLEAWSEEIRLEANTGADSGLVRDGLALFDELPRTADRDALLATDLHAGNVLRAAREPWLAIDPKPFLGDPAYDATQHLFNCRERLSANPDRTIKEFSDLLGVDAGRVRLWTFARAAAEPRSAEQDPDWTAIAKALSPKP
jgi:streptomycin 6-kinase